MGVVVWQIQRAIGSEKTIFCTYFHQEAPPDVNISLFQLLATLFLNCICSITIPKLSDTKTNSGDRIQHFVTLCFHDEKSSTHHPVAKRQLKGKEQGLVTLRRGSGASKLQGAELLCYPEHLAFALTSGNKINKQCK